MRHTRRALLTLAAGATAAASALLPVAGAHAATGTYSLVILPDQGESAIYNFVNSATKSIDVTIYELRDTTLVNDLVAKEKAGIPVRVILDSKQTSVNSAAYSALSAAGVGVTYSSSSFVYTHQKTITVDGAKSYISTGNFDTTYYATSRDYGVFDTDAKDVAAIEQVFNADYAKTSITPPTATTWSGRPPTRRPSCWPWSTAPSTAWTSRRRSSATPRWSTRSSRTSSAASPSGWWRRTRTAPTPASSTRSPPPAAR